MLWLVRQGSCDCGNCRGVFVVPWFSRPPPVWTGPSGDMYGIEATSAELRVMHVANQAVCRTLNLLARSKTLSKTQRHRTAVAVLGLGAVPDIVDLIARSDPEVEADPGMWQSVEDMHTYTHTHTHARIRALLAAAHECHGWGCSLVGGVAVGDDTVEAALVLLATIMPKGEGDGDIEDGQIVRTIPEYLREYVPTSTCL